MRVAIVAPVPAASSRGNGATARRWQDLLGDLGHEVALLGVDDDPGDADVLVALHATKCAPAIARSKRDVPGRRIVVGMAGTDLHVDLPNDPTANAAVRLADRIVVLYEGAERRLPENQRDKVTCIKQSAVPLAAPLPKAAGFQVCVLAHLRAIKDPLCAARAVQRLPADAGVRVVLAGEAYDDDQRAAATAAAEACDAFEWRGALPPEAAARLLAASHAMVLSSRSEGGANVLSEAIVAGVPVFASDIPANVGLLGADYPGYFPVGDDAALAALMLRAAREPAFLAALADGVAQVAPEFQPERERAAWAELLASLDG